jgi:L-rhamnose-H+ transport protein
MDTFIGVSLVGIGAVLGGLFALPSKFAGEDTPWEKLWGFFFLFAAFMIPPLGLLLVDGAWATWCSVGVVILFPLIFGAMWGSGSAAAATAYKLIGISLGFAIIPGIQVVLGPLVPMFVQHPETIATQQGVAVILGIVVGLLGVVACGRAGMLRSKGAGDGADASADRKVMVKGLLVCLLAGVLCACLNFAFSFGDPLLEASKTVHENTAAAATIVVWVPALFAGGLAACGYCIYLLTKNKTWASLKEPGTGKVVLLALLMALLHDGCLFFYGLGTQFLGDLGTSVGFALLFCGMMLVGNICGFATGEWKNASSPSRRFIMIGIGGLVMAICILAYSNTLERKTSPDGKSPNEPKQTELSADV